MGQQVNFSAGDIAQLLDLVTTVAREWDVSPPDAIHRMAEQLVGKEGSRRRHDRSLVAEFVGRLRLLRMRRNEIVGAPLFRDPAWDMLLELYVAHEHGRDLSVSSLCYASGVPPTTALRQLSRLEEHGLIAREGDGTDNRRWFVRPTEKALEGIAASADLLLEHSRLVSAAREAA